MAQRLAIALALVVAACSGDEGPPDIAGLYEITTHVESETGCTGGERPADAPIYFEITGEPLAGTTFYSLSECDAPQTCESTDGLVFEDTEEGWIGWYTVSSGSATACTLTYAQSEAIPDGDELTFEIRRHEEEGAIDPCTTDEAELRGESMPCVGYKTYVGTRAD